MTTDKNSISNLPIPPGEYLEEVIEELGMSKSELAWRMGRPLSKLSAVFSGDKAVTPDTALQIERATGVPAHIWTGLEHDYRLAQAKQKATERDAQCRHEIPMVTRFCYRELVRLGCLPASTRGLDKVRALQKFFGVMSLNTVLEMPRYKVAFRQGISTRSKRSPEAIAAWLRVGELGAQKAECAPFSDEILAAALDKLRPMTLRSPDSFQGELRQTLADAGVVLVFCPHFPKTAAHGATFFLTPEKAVVMLTLRYKWADIFWFTLFHEIGHLLLHDHKSVIIEDNGKTPREKEADAFARDVLIPPDAWHSFEVADRFTPDSIQRFARKVGIAPGIVVGRLQHESLLHQSVGNKMRDQYKFAPHKPE